MMKMFKKMDGDKKPKAAAKTVKVMKSKLTATPRVTATIQKSTMNSKTGAVTKSAPKKMGMKSITAKEFYK
jgi:hypothetical protein